MGGGLLEEGATVQAEGEHATSTLQIPTITEAWGSGLTPALQSCGFVVGHCPHSVSSGTNANGPGRLGPCLNTHPTGGSDTTQAWGSVPSTNPPKRGEKGDKTPHPKRAQQDACQGGKSAG